MRRVPAADIQGWIGLGITFFLGLDQRVCIAQPGLTHAGEDVIAGAIDDAVNGQDAIPHQPLLQHLDDRNASGHGGLKVDRHATLLRQREQLLPALR